MPIKLSFSAQDFERYTDLGEAPDDLECAVSHRLVVRPVINPERPQHVYEHKVLHRWLRGNETDPISRTPLTHDQPVVDGSRAVAAMAFRRQMAAHYKALAKAPDLPAEVAVEAQKFAATCTIQRFWLEHAAYRRDTSTHLYSALLRTIRNGLREVEKLRADTAPVVVDCALNEDTDDRVYLDISKRFHDYLRRRRILASAEALLAALPDEHKRSLFPTDSADWDAPTLEHQIGLYILVLEEKNALTTPEAMTKFLSDMFDAYKEMRAEEAEERRQEREFVEADMRHEQEVRRRRAAAATADDTQNDSLIGMAALEEMNAHVAAGDAQEEDEASPRAPWDWSSSTSSDESSDAGDEAQR